MTRRHICAMFILFVVVCASIATTSTVDAAGTMACTVLTRSLYRGASDATTANQVSMLQRFLASGGYYTYPAITGSFGPATETAVKLFQKKYNIASSGNAATTGYGFVGAVTRTKIKNISCGTTTPLPSPASAQQTATNSTLTGTVTGTNIPKGLTISCRPSSTQIDVGGLVTWNAQVTAPVGSYTYSWSGSDGLTGTGPVLLKTYSSAGVKSANVTINNSFTYSCPNTNVGNTTNLPPMNTAQTPPPPAPVTPVVTPSGNGGSQLTFNLYKDQSLDKYADHGFVWFTIGGASDYYPYRKVLLQSDTPPASNFWSTFFGPGNRWNGNSILMNGAQRVLVHNPFGQTAFTTDATGCTGGGMQSDQYLQAQAETPWLTSDFVSYWKPYVDAGMEVVGYVGSLDEVDNLNNASCAQMALQNNPTAYWNRAFAAVQPFLDAGMSIGLDASVATNINSYTYQFAQKLRAMGVRVYVESIPTTSNPQWTAFPFIIDNDIWWFSSQSFAMPLSAMKSDIYRFVKYPVTDIEISKQVMRDGYTTTINGQIPLRQAIPDYINPSISLVLGPSSLNYRITANPHNGTLAADSTKGVYIYTASNNFVGTDSFTFVTNTGGSDSAQSTATINVYAQIPFVTASQLMLAAKQAAGQASPKIVANFPVFDKEIQNLGITSMIPSTMVPKRVITFQINGSPVSFIAGYNQSTFAPMAVSSGRLLITDAAAPGTGGSQYAAVAKAVSSVDVMRSLWQSLIGFWQTQLF